MNANENDALPWITKEGTSVFVPKFGPIVIPSYVEDGSRTSFACLYDEGKLDQKPDGLYVDLPCEGCKAGRPHPEIEVMVFDVGNILEHQYTGSIGNHLYGLAEDVLGWKYEDFYKALALRSPQILWLMRNLEEFFKTSIHERINGWEAGSHTIFLQHIASERWKLIAHMLFYTVREQHTIYRHIWSLPNDHEGNRMGNGAYGEEALTIVLPLSPNVYDHD